MFRRTWKTVMLCFVCAIVIGLLARSSESFQHCIQQRKHSKPYQALHQKSDVFVKAVSRLQLNVACGFVASNENGGAISVLAGVAVAIFTGTLWWVTWDMVGLARVQRGDLLRSITAAERAADAASTQARVAETTLRDLERPYVFVDNLSYIRVKTSDGLEGALRLTLANYGRTPAIMYEVESRMMIYPVPDINAGMSLVDKHSFPSNDVIGAGKTSRETDVSGRILDSHLASRIMNGSTRLAVTLHVRYGNVFDQTVREDVFSLAYDHSLRMFLREKDIPDDRTRYNEDD